MDTQQMLFLLICPHWYDFLYIYVKIFQGRPDETLPPTLTWPKGGFDLKRPSGQNIAVHWQPEGISIEFLF